MVPSQGSVSSTTPSSARIGHASACLLWLRKAATVRGPRNSIATHVPSGMRSIAARNITPISPLATPKPSRAGRSRRRISRTRGRASNRKITAPAVSRSQAVAAAPTSAITFIDNAALSCAASIAAIARLHGGSLTVRVVVMVCAGRWSSRQSWPGAAAAGSRRRCRVRVFAVRDWR